MGYTVLLALWSLRCSFQMLTTSLALSCVAILVVDMPSRSKKTLNVYLTQIMLNISNKSYIASRLSRKYEWLFRSGIDIVIVADGPHLVWRWEQSSG